MRYSHYERSYTNPSLKKENFSTNQRKKPISRHVQLALAPSKREPKHPTKHVRQNPEKSSIQPHFQFFLKHILIGIGGSLGIILIYLLVIKPVTHSVITQSSNIQDEKKVSQQEILENSIVQPVVQSDTISNFSPPSPLSSIATSNQNTQPNLFSQPFKTLKTALNQLFPNSNLSKLPENTQNQNIQPFTPPLIEISSSPNNASQLLPSEAYAEYLNYKKVSKRLPIYKNSIVYDSEADEKIPLEQIGDFTDEEGKDILIQTSNPYTNEIMPIKPGVFEAFSHTIREGESLWSLSRKYEISIDSLITFNAIKNVHHLKVGKTLSIPYHSGVYHTVQQGESIYSIAETYAVHPDKVQADSTSDSFLIPSQKVFVPNVRIETLKRRQLFGNLFLLPISGILSSPYGMRLHPIHNKLLFHTGIDLAANYGTPIKASLAGKVRNVGSVGNYGKRIVITHALGYQTTYSHLSKFLVKPGQTVRRGQVIGLIGNSGLSTGPHLHFEIKHHNRYVNPIQFFKTLKSSPKSSRSQSS